MSESTGENISESLGDFVGIGSHHASQASDEKLRSGK